MAPGLLERQFLRTRNGLAYLAGSNRPVVAQTPRDEIWQRDKARLWRYRSENRHYRPPVLIVHSLVSKSYILDLLPGASMIGHLLGEGFDVFLLDWEPAGPGDSENTFETYVDDYMTEAIGAALNESGGDEVTLVGYCFGGVLTLLLAAAHPELPIRNMMVMATPCDYREMGFMSNMFSEERLNADDVIDADRAGPGADARRGIPVAQADRDPGPARQLLREPVERRVRRGIPGDRDLGARPSPVPGRRFPSDRRRADPPERPAERGDPVRPRRGPARRTSAARS